MRSLSVIALVLLSASGSADTAAVRTDTGLVQGVLDDDVIVYKGIPFAAPPVGNLRWKAPPFAMGPLPRLCMPAAG